MLKTPSTDGASNRARQVPGEDIRAVHDNDTEKGSGLRLLPGRDSRGVPHAGDDGGILEDNKAQEEQDRNGADEYLRGEVGQTLTEAPEE